MYSEFLQSLTPNDFHKAFNIVNPLIRIPYPIMYWNSIDTEEYQKNFFDVVDKELEANNI